MDFEWSVKMENETEIHRLQSSLLDKENMSFLRISVDKGRTYQCVANNSVGVGTICSIEITGNVFNPELLHNIFLSVLAMGFGVGLGRRDGVDRCSERLSFQTESFFSIFFNTKS